MVCALVENIRRVASRYRMTMSRESGNAGHLAKSYFELEDGHLRLRHVPVPTGIFHRSQLSAEDARHVDIGGPNANARKLVNTYLRPLKSVIQAVSGYQPVPEYDDPRNSAWQLMKAPEAMDSRNRRPPDGGLPDADVPPHRADCSGGQLPQPLRGTRRAGPGHNCRSFPASGPSLPRAGDSAASGATLT